MQRKTCLITLGRGALGHQIARDLVAASAHVILVARSSQKLEKTKKCILEDTGASCDRVTCETVDLSLYSEIQSFISRFESSGRALHVLINNIAVAPTSRRETRERLEMQFATNVLSYYWLTEGLATSLERSSSDEEPARVIMCASYCKDRLKLNDLQFRGSTYSSEAAYSQSKLCARLLVDAFASHLHSRHILVNACVSSPVLAKDLNFTKYSNGSSPNGTKGDAAKTTVWLATCPDHQSSGKCFEDCCEKQDLPNKEDAQNLWKICQRITADVVTAAEEPPP